MAHASIHAQVRRQRIGAPQIGDGARRVGGRLAGQRDTALIEVAVLGVGIGGVALHAPLPGQLQSGLQLDAAGTLLADQQTLTRFLRVAGGDVLAFDVEERHRRIAPSVQEAHLAADLQLPARGQLGVVGERGEIGAGQVARGRVGRRGVLGVDHHPRADVPGGADAARGGVVGAADVAFVDRVRIIPAGVVQLHALVAQRSDQLDGRRQLGAVLQVRRHRVHSMPVLRVIAGRNALDVVEVLGHEAVRIDYALEVVVVRRVGGLAVERHIQTEAPVAAVAAQVLAQRAVDAVAIHPLVMTLQQRAGTRHLGSCRVQLVDFHVAVVAQRIIGIEGVLQRQRVARLPLGH